MNLINIEAPAVLFDIAKWTFVATGISVTGGTIVAGEWFMSNLLLKDKPKVWSETHQLLNVVQGVVGSLTAGMWGAVDLEQECPRKIVAVSSLVSACIALTKIKQIRPLGWGVVAFNLAATVLCGFFKPKAKAAKQA